MGRDGQLANCDPDGQKIDKARDTYGARCDAVCLEEGQLVVYKRAEKFYARVAEWRAFPLASLLTPIAKFGRDRRLPSQVLSAEPLYTGVLRSAEPFYKRVLRPG